MDFNGIINSLFGSVQATVTTVALGLAGIIGAAALVSILKEIVPTLFNLERPQFNQHIGNCLKVLGLCIVAGFAVVLVNAAINYGNTGLNLGAVNVG